MDEKTVVGLSDAIEALRRELLIAAAVGKDEPMRFALEPIELTVQVALTKDAHGDVGWMVLQAGARLEKMTTQSLTVRLVPLWRKADGTPTATFSIASDEFDKEASELGIGRRKN